MNIILIYKLNNNININFIIKLLKQKNKTSKFKHNVKSNT